MAAPSLALLDRTLPSHHHHAAAFGGSDRLSKEIFSILESNFLFGAQPEGGACSAGRVRVLSIDGASDGGALAAAALVRLERRLQELSGNPAARVADFFDVAAGSGAGGFLAAALFACRMPAEAARDVVAKNRKVFSGRHGRGGLFRRPEAVFKKVFGDLTVRDAAKPLLIPCYDMATAAPFVFSRADAVEAEAFDFPLWQVCAAACGVGPAEVACLDGRTRLRAAAATGGGGAVANPTAVAVTHVLHNKREFPFAAGAGDLVVLSLGGDAAASAGHASSSSLLRIAGACQADMVRGPSRINGVRREQSNQLHPYPGQRHCSRSDGGGGHDGAGRGVRPVPGKEADAADQRGAAGRRGRAACAGAAPEAGEQDARGVHQAVGDAKDLLLVGVHAHHGVHQLLLGVALRLDRYDDAIN